MIKTGCTLLKTIVTSRFNKICSRDLGRQSFILPPMVFNVVNDWILKSAPMPFFKLTVDSYFDDLLYADDRVLLRKNDEDAQRFLRKYQLPLSRSDFFFSVPINKALFFNCDTPYISLKDTNLANIDAFTFLCSIANTTTGSDETKTRIEKFQYAFKHLRLRLWEKNEWSLPSPQKQEFNRHLFSMSYYIAFNRS